MFLLVKHYMSAYVFFFFDGKNCFAMECKKKLSAARFKRESVNIILCLVLMISISYHTLIDYFSISFTVVWVVFNKICSQHKRVWLFISY